MNCSTTSPLERPGRFISTAQTRPASRHLLSIALILGTLLPLGCVRRDVDGETTTYTTRPWVIAIVALGAVAAAVAGWYIRPQRRLPGSILLGGGILVLCTTVPGLALSRTIIDGDHLEWTRGIKQYHFRFDDLAGIEHTVKNIPIGRTIHHVHYLDFTTKAGKKIHIQVEPGSDHFLQDAIPEILKRARRRGVPCTEVGPP